MFRKLRIITVLLFCTGMMVACITQPPIPTAQVEHDGNPCESLVEINLSDASKVYPGDTFWNFFVNFKKRTLEPTDETANQRLRIDGCLRLYERQRTDEERSAFPAFPTRIETIPCYWQGVNFNQSEENWNEIAPQFNDAVGPLETSIKGGFVEEVTSVSFAEENFVSCSIMLSEFGIHPQSYLYFTIVAAGEALTTSDNNGGNLFRYQSDSGASKDVQMGILSHGDLNTLTTTLNGLSGSGCEVLRKFSSFLWTDVEQLPDETISLKFKWRAQGESLASNDSEPVPHVCVPDEGNLTELNSPIELDPGAAMITIGGNLIGSLYEVWVDPDDLDKR